MNHGCSTTISRPDGKVRNGTRKVLLVRRKHAWADAGWKLWLLFSSTAVALCTKNLYLQDRQLIMPSTKMSWNEFETGSSESERTLQTTGCCTTITRQPTLCFQFENFWRRKHSRTSTSSLQPRSTSVRFLPLLQVEIEVEGSSFREDGKHTKNCNPWATHTYGKWLPVLLWSVEKMLEPLCNFPRVTLWRK